jgi:hypothetical protein
MNAPDQACLARVHHAFVEPLLRTGTAPTRTDVAAALGMDVVELDAVLTALAATHGAVLDPHSGKPWVLHPFSLTPTATW